MGYVRSFRPVLCLIAIVSIFDSATIQAQQKRSATSSSAGAKLFADLSPSIVSVETFDDDSLPTKRGTAVFVFGENVAVTNAHVLLNASRVVVRTPAGQSAAAEVAYADVDRDVALLVVPSSDLEEPRRDFPISDEEPVIGTHVYAISNPLGMDRTLTEGIVSSIRTFERLGRVVQHTAAISPGSSGGALFNDSGTLVGIVTAQLPQGQSLNFAITSSTILNALEQWAEGDATAKFSPGEYAVRTRWRFPEFASLSDRELLERMVTRRPDQSGMPPSLRRGQAVPSLLVSNPNGLWIDDGGLATRLSVPAPPLTIAVGRDGTYFMTAGTESVSGQDIRYLISARLRRAGDRLSGEITVGYYMRSTGDRYACSTSGTLEVRLSADGNLLSGTSVISSQPHSVAAPFDVLCAALPSGTRRIRLTRQ